MAWELQSAMGLSCGTGLPPRSNASLVGPRRIQPNSSLKFIDGDSLTNPVRHAVACLRALVLMLTASTSVWAADEQAGPSLTGAPVGTTAESNPTIYVADSHATTYKHSINKAPYSSPVPIDTPLRLKAKAVIEVEAF